SFEWNTKPHPSRVVKIDEKILKILATTFEDSEDWEGTKLVSIHAQEMLSAITKIGLFQTNVSDYEHIVLEGWHETNDINKENIQRETKYPDFDQYEMIYSGPHIYVSNP